MTNKAFLVLLLVFTVVWRLDAQAQPSPAQSNPQRRTTKVLETRIEGAGSSALDPLMRSWIDEYSRLHPGTRISYKALGSKAALRMLAAKTASFGTTDTPVPDDQPASANGRLVQFPVAVTAVIPVYNLDAVPELRFSGGTLADIFLGKITKWNDPAVIADNPGTNLPPMDIKVEHYFPNGTVETRVIADYLSQVSSDFKKTLNASPNGWPLASIGYKGGEGIAGFVSTTPGSIGYLGLAPAHLYEQTGSLKWGAVKNSDGDFVMASPKSLTTASETAVPVVHAQANFGVQITNAPGKGSYPIASFIWLTLYEKPDEGPEERKKHEVMKDFLKRVLTDGQKLALKLGYPALPDNLVKLELERLEGGDVSRDKAKSGQ